MKATQSTGTLTSDSKKKVSKGAVNQAAKRRVAEQSFCGWVDGTHHPQKILVSSQGLAGRKNAVPR